MLFNYLYLYLINPIFLLLDYFYEYKEDTRNNKEMKETYEYDINEDKIIITYFSNEGKKFILKVDRKVEIDLKTIIENLKLNETNDIILGANYNEDNDVTKQVLEYLGPSGKHLDFYKLVVRDVLTEEQISNFKKLTIIDEMCEINELNGLNEYLL